METITMSRKESRRPQILEAILHGKLTQEQAARQLNLSSKQVGRLLKRYKALGLEGLIHKGRGKTSNRALSKELKQQILELAQGQFKEFGPTFMAEKLEELHKIKISNECLRKLLISNGLWEPKKKNLKQYIKRTPKPCFGELIQIDGSKHIWFGDQYATLISFVDDATNTALLYFVPEECLAGYIYVLEWWITSFGVPLALYSDRHQIFQSNNGINRNLTQFQQVLESLSIKLKRAYSPQAKGRVERSHGTHQDRLVKELRLAGIKNIDAANEFLINYYIEKHNKMFSKEPASSFDAHRPTDAIDFNTVFSRRQKRTLTNDRTIQFEGQTFVIECGQKITVSPGMAISVAKGRNGTIALSFKGITLKHRQIVRRKKASKNVSQCINRPPWRPGPNHPWRRFKM